MVAGELLLKQGGRGLAFNEVKRTGSPAKKPSVDVISTHQQMDRRVGGIQPQPAQAVERIHQGLRPALHINHQPCRGPLLDRAYCRRKGVKLTAVIQWEGASL